MLETVILVATAILPPTLLQSYPGVLARSQMDNQDMKSFPYYVQLKVRQLNNWNKPRNL